MLRCASRRSHSASWDTPSEVTSVFIDPVTISEISFSETGSERVIIVPQYGIRDPLIRAIGGSLDTEAASRNPHPRIYAESLATALIAHIIAKYSTAEITTARRGFPHRTQLLRSIEYMRENLAKDLTLGEIAAVANMSKYHFAKFFRGAMGIAPHRYLIRLRIEKSRDLLGRDTLSIEEVASRVGYADKGHFAAQFARVVGVSPNRYRAERWEFRLLSRRSITKTCA